MLVVWAFSAERGTFFKLPNLTRLLGYVPRCGGGVRNLVQNHHDVIIYSFVGLMSDVRLPKVTKSKMSLRFSDFNALISRRSKSWARWARGPQKKINDSPCIRSTLSNFTSSQQLSFAQVAIHCQNCQLQLFFSRAFYYMSYENAWISIMFLSSRHIE